MLTCQVKNEIKKKNYWLKELNSITHFIGHNEKKFDKSEEKLLTFIYNRIVPFLSNMKMRDKYTLGGRQINVEKLRIENLLRELTSTEILDKKSKEYKSIGIESDLDLYLFDKQDNVTSPICKEIQDKHKNIFSMPNGNRLVDQLKQALGHIKNDVEGSTRNLKTTLEEKNKEFVFSKLSFLLLVAAFFTTLWFVFPALENYSEIIEVLNKFSWFATWLGFIIQVFFINLNKKT